LWHEPCNGDGHNKSGKQDTGRRGRGEREITLKREITRNEFEKETKTMRNMKRLMAVAILMVVASMGAQTAMANDGILVTDNNFTGILVTDSHKDGILLSDKATGNTWDSILGVIINGLTGILVTD
jgi:hypothetical protein